MTRLEMNDCGNCNRQTMKQLHSCSRGGERFCLTLHQLLRASASPDRHYIAAGEQPELPDEHYAAAGALSPVIFITFVNCRPIFRLKKEQTVALEAFRVPQSEQTSLQERFGIEERYQTVTAGSLFPSKVMAQGCRSRSGNKSTSFYQLIAHYAEGDSAPTPADSILFGSKNGLHRLNDPAGSSGLYSRQLNGHFAAGETAPALAVTIFFELKTDLHRMDGAALQEKLYIITGRIITITLYTLI